jgi:hypothetical protein
MTLRKCGGGKKIAWIFHLQKSRGKRAPIIGSQPLKHHWSAVSHVSARSGELGCLQSYMRLGKARFDLIATGSCAGRAREGVRKAWK